MKNLLFEIFINFLIQWIIAKNPVDFTGFKWLLIKTAILSLRLQQSLLSQRFR